MVVFLVWQMRKWFHFGDLIWRFAWGLLWCDDSVDGWRKGIWGIEFSKFVVGFSFGLFSVGEQGQ